MNQDTRSAIARALAQGLHDTGKPLADGKVEVDPSELERSVIALLGDAAPQDEEYDAVKDGKERGRAQNEAKVDGSLMWR